MAPRPLPTITAATLHVDAAAALRRSLVALNVGRQLDALNVHATLRRSLPRLTVLRIPTIPVLKGPTHDVD